MDAYLQSARDAIEEAAGSLDAKALARKTGDRWSVAEILEHLTLAFSASAAALEKPLASGELRTRAPVLKQRLLRGAVLELGFFPRRNAPEMTRPTGSIPIEHAMSSIRGALDRLDSTLTKVGEQFGEDIAVANHPFFSGMSVRHWRKFHWRHAVHHVKQVKNRSVGP